MTTLASTLAGVCIGVLAAGPLSADQTDFARGRVLDPAEGSVVQRLTMPDDVYEWVTRDDLGDVRVINSEQREVPYTIRRPQRTESDAPWTKLPMFPLPRPEGDAGKTSEVEIQVNAAGSIVSVSGAGQGGVTESTTAVLLDLSGLDWTPTQLRLEWVGAEDFVGRIRVEASNDLDVWRPLVNGATIARLTNAGQSVELNEIELPPRPASYLRLIQMEGNMPLDVESIEARHRNVEQPSRHWKILTGVAADDGIVFDSKGRFPVDRVQLLDAVSDSYIVNVKLYSRRTPEDSWRHRGVRSFYRTTVADQVVESDPLAVDDGSRYWRVRFTGAPLAEPRLRVGWLPDEVVFLEQGKGPYVLAYGRAATEPREWPLTDLLARLGNGRSAVDLAAVPFAEARAPEMLGGADRLKPPPEPVDWQTLVLWAVLVLGVAVVGVFAIRLLHGGQQASP